MMLMATLILQMRDDGGLPLICPTCQLLFAETEGIMPAATGYFAWGCFPHF
jgi:hypothetical protein